MDLFVQHPLQWWNGLDVFARVGLVAVGFGLCTVLVATWMGVHKWWRHWKQNPNDEDE